MGHAHGKQWTEDMITDEIIRVVESLNLKHFPTHSEMYAFYGNKALSNKISKSGGTRYWADKLGLQLKWCESETGNAFELMAIEHIKAMTGFESVKTKPRYPYDLLTDNNIKVDVKVSYPTTNQNGVMANSFNLEKCEPTCDLFVFYCLKKDGSVFKTLIIPSCVLRGKTQIGVGLLSKWDAFENCWWFFKLFSEFYASVSSLVRPLERRRSEKADWK